MTTHDQAASIRPNRKHEPHATQMERLQKERDRLRGIISDASKNPEPPSDRKSDSGRTTRKPDKRTTR